MSTEHHCLHEERFANIEKDLAELKARADNKKEDIHNINKELLRDRQQQTELLETVTKVTVLLEQGQEQRKNNNQKLEDLENKLDELQKELADNKSDVIELTSSLNSFRNTVLAAVPIISVIVGVVLHYI